MLKKLVLGGVLGSLVLMAWSTVSWMALPFHMKSFATLADEAAVGKVLVKNAPADGIYLLPNMHAAIAAAPADQRKAVEEKCQAAMKAGPTGFLVIHPGGVDMKAAMGRMMGRGFLIGAAACAVVTWIILQATGAGFLVRTVIAVLAGAGGAISTNMNYWNWWGFSGPYTCLESCDLLAGWVLAGLVLAKVTGGKRKKR